MEQAQPMENQSQKKTTFKSDKEIVKESKDSLKKEIKKVSEQLKGLCNDAAFAESLIDKLLSLKGQYDIEPTLVHVPIASVIKEYDFGHFKLIRTNRYIVFHIAGMDMVVPPMLQTLYGQLNWLLDVKDNLSELNEQEIEIYDCVFNATMVILMNPVICFSNEKYYMDIAAEITKKQISLFESSLNEELKPEDSVADEEFNRTVEFAEQLREEAKQKGESNELQ